MIRFFASHPTAANLLMIGFFVLGIQALPSIQRATSSSSARIRHSAGAASPERWTAG